jgi:hypothetical protein
MAKKTRGSPDGRITSRPYGKLQVVRSKRKIFGKELQALFFAELAETCNIRASARAAGVSWQCVYQRKDRDPEFRARLRSALAEAYEWLEWRMLEETNGGAAPASPPLPNPSPAEGGGAKFDKDLALHLLREHKKGLAGVKRGGAPALRSAEWSEVEAYFIARLRALKKRIDGEGGAPSPSRCSTTGPSLSRKGRGAKR